MISKVFEKLVNNRTVDHLEKCGFFLISSMVLGLLNELQIFIQLYLMELLELLTGLYISKAFDRVCHGGLLHKLKSYGISGQIFGLISFVSGSGLVLDWEWFWMGSLCKNI